MVVDPYNWKRLKVYDDLFIYLDIQMRGGNWEEIQENRKWVNRHNCRFLCNSRLISLEMI